jgi:predicted metal-binding membrane protein
LSTRQASPPGRAGLALNHLLSRHSLIVGAALLALVLMAWAWLLSHPHAPMADMPAMPGRDMAGMEMGGMTMNADPWSFAYLATAFAMWSVMMVAMMLPSAAPMILLHARIDRSDSESRRLLHSLLFVAAYVALWTGFSALAAAAQALLLHNGLLSAATLALDQRVAASALLLLAAAYELTPAKHRCLKNCQSPLIFIHRYWKAGAAGAFSLGTRHGLYCVGCCWALMLLLFAGGVMNLAWIAPLTILAAIQKVAPPRWRLHRWTAALLLLLAGLLAIL